MNIATGFVAPPSTSVDKTEGVSMNKLNEMHASENLKTFTIRKKDIAVQIPRRIAGLLKLDTFNNPVREVNHLVYLQISSTVDESDQSGTFKLDDVIKSYELYCVSLALFYKNGFMRTGDKSKLAEYLVKDSAKISYEDAKDLVKKGETKVVMEYGWWSFVAASGRAKRSNFWSNINASYTKKNIVDK